jgi:hypothetical protein
MRLVGHTRLQQSHASAHGVGAAAVGVEEAFWPVQHGWYFECCSELLNDTFGGYPALLTAFFKAPPQLPQPVRDFGQNSTQK